jgi:hypothetical protein
MTTACAGKLTPQARVEVQHRTYLSAANNTRITYLDSLILKHPLHHIPVTPKHASMMNTKPSVK